MASPFDWKVFVKNQIITERGETENYLSYIESGIVRFYIPDGEKN